MPNTFETGPIMILLSFTDGQAVSIRLSRQIDTTVKKMKTLIDIYNSTACVHILLEEVITPESNGFKKCENVIIYSLMSLIRIHMLTNHVKYTIFSVSH